MRRQAWIEVGKRLKDARVRVGLTQREVATLLGLSETSIARYEIGYTHTPIPRLHQFARLYNAPALSRVATREVTMAAAVPHAPPPPPLPNTRGLALFAKREPLRLWWTRRIERVRRAEQLDQAQFLAVHRDIPQLTRAMLQKAAVPRLPTERVIRGYMEALLQLHLGMKRLGDAMRAHGA